MKMQYGLLLALFLVACKNEPISAPTTDTSKNIALTAVQLQALDAKAEDVRTKMKRWYADNRQNCGSSGTPAFLCSGLTMRATESYQAFNPWEPSPGSITRKGVSFIWWRQDVPIASLYPTRNGFVFYPVFETPANKYNGIHMLCIFPRDGATNQRMPACGTNPNYPESKPCNTQGINTAEQWMTHYNSLAAKGAACGWGVSQGSGDTANRFYQSIRARNMLYSGGDRIWNELIVEPWNNVDSRILPIISFFYIRNEAGGLAAAQDDQRRYNAQYGEIIPIIDVALHTKGSAEFTYRQADQAVTLRQ